MNQLMSEYGLNKCSFYVVDSVNSHVTYGVHVAVIGVNFPRARGLNCAPINANVTPCHSPHASEGWFLVDRIAVDGAEYRVGFIAV